MFHYKFKKNGFTLIELLVVISIIGLITSLLIYSVSLTRMKARDTKRKADLEQARKALQLYAYDHDGLLPVTGFGSNNSGQGWATNEDDGSVCYSAYGDLEDFLDGSDANVPAPANFYLKMNHDPKCGGCTGCNASEGGYMYYRNGNCGVLYAHLEAPTGADATACSKACRGVPGYGMNYCVQIIP